MVARRDLVGIAITVFKGGFVLEKLADFSEKILVFLIGIKHILGVSFTITLR